MPVAGRDDSTRRCSLPLAATAGARARGWPSLRPPVSTTLTCWTVRTGKPYDERGMRLVATDSGGGHVGRCAPHSALDLGGTV